MSDIGSLIEGDDLRALVDIGIMAISRGIDGPAATIFAGVVAARPHHEAGHIGQALVHLYRNEIDPAVALLRKLPPSDAARLFLGMALARQGQVVEARAILADLVETAAGTPPAVSARQILDAM